MKKLMFLLIILAMVNVANAGIIDIAITSLNGVPIEPTNEIFNVQPTDIVDLSIMWEAPAAEYLFSLGVVLNVSGPGTLDLSAIQADALFDPSLEAVGPNWLVEVANMTLNPGLGPQGQTEPYAVVWDIFLHCDDEGLVEIYLSDYPDNPSFAVDEYMEIIPTSYGPGVTIHQIPEPMTLTLLGLGGLVLLRRKK